jgi:hypothetical protein
LCAGEFGTVFLPYLAENLFNMGGLGRFSHLFSMERINFATCPNDTR